MTKLFAIRSSLPSWFASSPPTSAWLYWWDSSIFTQTNLIRPNIRFFLFSSAMCLSSWSGHGWSENQGLQFLDNLEQMHIWIMFHTCFSELQGKFSHFWMRKQFLMHLNCEMLSGKQRRSMRTTTTRTRMTTLKDQILHRNLERTKCVYIEQISFNVDLYTFQKYTCL